MNVWLDFVGVIGKGENDSVVADLFRNLGESPIISETPDSYNDPEGKTKFYKFIKSGLEIGFRLGRLNHIHFFIQCHEGYSACKADVLGRTGQAWTVQDVVAELGPPSKEVSGKFDPLIGNIRQWLKYDLEGYAVRMEFSEDGRLWKTTIMCQ